ncbi:MAG TPA: PTS sugar transporter subunit IIA [bacterium]
MVGVMLATHGGLGEALIAAMEMIAGGQPQVAALSLQVADRLEDAAERLQAAVAGVDDGDGVLVLTDMLGGTPSNLCLSLLGGTPPVEVVSGASLPMLLKAVQARRDAGLAETAAQVKKTGRAAIIVASEVLAGPEPRGEGGARP